MKKIFAIFLLLFLSMFAQNAEEIVSKAENTIKGKSAYGEIEMTVTNPDFTRSLTMESWYVGNNKALIVVKSPRKEAGNKTLKIGNEMWTYLKNTQTTIKVPPSMMLQSWNGSDFTNDDIVRESNLAKDYNQKIIGNDNIDGEKCWKIQLDPKPDAPVVWGKLFYWVRQKDNLPAKVEYYDEKGKLMRFMSFSEVQTMGGRTIPTNWTMHNVVKENHSTSIKLLKMKFDINIPDKTFSFRELERGN